MVLFFILKEVIKQASHLHKQHHSDQQENAGKENQSSYVLSDSLATHMGIFVL